MWSYWQQGSGEEHANIIKQQELLETLDAERRDRADHDEQYEVARRVTAFQFETLASEYYELNEKHDQLLRLLEEQSNQIRILAKERAEREIVQVTPIQEAIHSPRGTTIQVDAVSTKQVLEQDVACQASQVIPIQVDQPRPSLPTRVHSPVSILTCPLAPIPIPPQELIQARQPSQIQSPIQSPQRLIQSHPPVPTQVPVQIPQEPIQVPTQVHSPRDPEESIQVHQSSIQVSQAQESTRIYQAQNPVAGSYQAPQGPIPIPIPPKVRGMDIFSCFDTNFMHTEFERAE